MGFPRWLLRGVLKIAREKPAKFSQPVRYIRILISAFQVGMFKGAWIPGQSAGGCRNYLESFAQNPQYRITVTDPDDDDDDNLCTVIVSLMQKGRRAMRDEGMGCLTIGIATIFQLAPKFFEARL